MNQPIPSGPQVQSARNWADSSATGYTTSTLHMPDGLGFFDPKRGVYFLDIVPYVVGEGNPRATRPGALWFEREYWQYRSIGIEEKSYVCPSKTFGDRDYIQEWRATQARNPNIDAKFLKSLEPKQRQLFLVWNREDQAKGIQLWEFSYYNFGKLLGTRIANSRESDGWEFFYDPGPFGCTLRLEIEDVSQGGYQFIQVKAIDFLRRNEALPQQIVQHGICLDKLLVKTEYEELKRIFEGGVFPGAVQQQAPQQNPGGQFFGNGNPQGGYMPPAIDHNQYPQRPIQGPQTSGYVAPQQPVQQAPFSIPPAALPPVQQQAVPTQTAPAPVQQAPPPRQLPTADQFGLTRGQEVLYQNQECAIVKISPDGASLTLMRKSDDEILKAVGPEEVQVIAAAQAKPASAPVQSAAGGDDWDKDWGKKNPG